MRVTKDYVFFFTFKDVFSNWYISDIWYTGPFSPGKEKLKFDCVEQYMMWAKASFFQDNLVAEAILTKRMKYADEKDQAYYKRMGRKVRNFDSTLWDSAKESIVKHGLRLKFSPGSKVHKELMSYPGKTFVEASPYDAIYGIKMGMWDEGVENPANWKGENLLGKWLTDLRDEFEEELHGN